MIGITLVLVLLLFIAGAELFYPQKLYEGFQSVIPALNPDAGYFAKFVPRRGDIAPGEEQGGYIQDPRYFMGYVDVQRLGVNHDFCRMVESRANKDDKFFACALAGTENLSGVEYRTPSLKNGFRMSRDDYMRDIEGFGRSSYCRILKNKVGNYEPMCNRALDTEFDDELVIDTNPPVQTQMFLRFYQGCVFWYRFRDDMVDYVNNTKIMKVGGISINEKPNPEETEGVIFNGADQYIRLGDSVDLELGAVVPLRSLRAIMVWVYFEEFTNNAHIVDFGDGAGVNNVVLGIIGKGDSNVADAAILRKQVICGEDSTVPSPPSGQQRVEIMSPQKLMESTSANVDELDCPGFELEPRKLPPSRVTPRVPVGKPSKATLLYEIWDNQQRKMRIVIPAAIPKQKWTHICVTAKTDDAFRPDIEIFINGERAFVEPSGFLPQASTLSNCYLGKSNWMSDTSQYENRDELFKGKMFDVRGYKVPVPARVLKETVMWGREKLNIKPEDIEQQNI